MTAHTIQTAARKLNLRQRQLWGLLQDLGAIWRDRDGYWRAATKWRSNDWLREHVRFFYRGPVCHHYIRLKVTEAGLVELWSALDEQQAS